MRSPLIFVLASLVGIVLATAMTTTTTTTTRAADPLSLRVLTFNIRYAAAGSKYEKPWSVRGPLVIGRVAAAMSAAAAAAETNNAVPVVGMQEVLHAQLQDIAAGLGPAWAHIGTGRDDGKEAGEYCPIFYRPDRARLLATTQKWLSPTPDVPSFWPGAGSRRYVLVAVFEEAATGRRFVAANTHLDNASSRARSEGVRIALAVIRDVRDAWRDPGSNPDPLPVVLTGDFNSEPGGDAYAEMVRDGYLRDAYELADARARFGPYETYTGFVPDEIPDVGGRIDFLWLGPDADAAAPWDVVRYEVLDNVVDGVFISDHRPVFGDIVLRAT
ncbi:Endonuclease/exonuclease/phosphatase [Nemania sp. NC0429]|nr:Endonuclease/exonuclease/phosphatase [Nemania sp. NC0429]